MAILSDIWIESYEGEKPAVRLDWSNDRHQRIEIEGDSPKEVARSIQKLAILLNSEIKKGHI